jgi:hypothetical protein
MPTTSPAEDLKGWLREPRIQPDTIARHLDSLRHEQRVESIRALGRSEQRALYTGVEGHRAVALREIVPPSTGDFTTVRHFGKNTLPAFSHFEKRFCRPRGGDREKPSELFGFNFQTMAPVTGPGYFVARGDEQRGEVLVDYNEVPDSHPDGWPGIKRNEAGLSRFVYGFMIDTLRGVSEHVTIGSAARRGKDLGSWFVLCREA